MILQSLSKLAEREKLIENPDFERKEVHWRINLKPDGRFIFLESLIQESSGTGKKRRPQGIKMLIPRQSGRTSGDKAEFLVDKAEYIFGFGDRDVAKLVLRSNLFVEMVKRAAEDTGDEGLKAVLEFLTSPQQMTAARGEVANRIEKKEISMNHLFVFRMEGDSAPFVHLRPKVMEYWSQFRLPPAKASEFKQCLISGIFSIPVDKHPPIKRVPGGTPSGVAIVSFNSSAFESYDFSRNDNAPVSRSAAEAYTTALNRLLDSNWPDPKNSNVRLPEQRVLLSNDTVAVFWTDDPSRIPSALVPAIGEGNFEAIAEFGIPMIDESWNQVSEEPDLVESTEPLSATYEAPWKGITPAELEDAHVFRLLILSGGQGRATVRAFYSSRISKIVEAVRSWFEDIRLSTFRGKPALWRLLRSLAVRGDRKNLQPNLASEVFLSILSARELPLQILEAAVRRCRSEPNTRELGGQTIRNQKVTPERAALIKAFLNRARNRLTSTMNIKYEEVKPMLNENERNRGYLLGRMFACIERMQELALGDVGASVTDRYFSSACATPQVVFPRLLKTEVHHFRKAREGQWKSTAQWLHRQIDQLAVWLVGEENKMQEGETIESFLRRNAGRPIKGFPAFLPLPEQGLFTLGYHQQRAEFFRSRQSEESKMPVQS